MGKNGLIRVVYLFLGVRSVHESELFGLAKAWELADRAPDGTDFFFLYPLYFASLISYWQN